MCIDSKDINDKIVTSENNDAMSWFAARIFHTKQMKFKSFLEENGIECFVPTEDCELKMEGGEYQVVSKPVVSNLLFIKTQLREEDIQSMVNQTDFNPYFFKKDNDSNKFYHIPASQMEEFIALSETKADLKKYITGEQAQLKKGTPVFVKYGPLKGLQGKLVRQDKKYYLLKEIPGVGIMLKISKWCCRPLTE